MNNFNEFIQKTTEEIKHVYLFDNRPWVVGYSGGKDSTAVIQLIFNALMEISNEKRHKQVFIISSDTLIETPLIISFIENTMTLLSKKAEELGLPITCHFVRPSIDKSFWVNLIGKGYPLPRQKFRWCTDRLKIEPANYFIKDKVSEHGEVIMIIGIRKGESQSRDKVISSHEVEGKLLRRHTTLNNAFVYAPVINFNTGDIWEYLLSNNSPWGCDNRQLLALYLDSSSEGECPLVTDQVNNNEMTATCGNSRFGCWVCTVVKEDKALIGFIDNGNDWLIPLLEFRNWLVENRDTPSLRDYKRKDGSVYYIGTGEERHRGMGPFNLYGRKTILKKLLACEKNIKEDINSLTKQLISLDELKLIRKLWVADGDWEDSLPQIYNDVYGLDIDWDFDERPLLSGEELALLESLCINEELPFELMKKLISIETDAYALKYRPGIFKKINSVMNQGWIHHEKIEGLLNDNK